MLVEQKYPLVTLQTYSSNSDSISETYKKDISQNYFRRPTLMKQLSDSDKDMNSNMDTDIDRI
jgi:hypothetical protein